MVGMHCIVQLRHLEVVKYLVVEGGCDPNVLNNKKNNTLHCAANGGHLDIVEYLIEKRGCDPSIGNLDGSNALHCR